MLHSDVLCTCHLATALPLEEQHGRHFVVTFSRQVRTKNGCVTSPLNATFDVFCHVFFSLALLQHKDRRSMYMIYEPNFSACFACKQKQTDPMIANGRKKRTQTSRVKDNKNQVKLQLFFFLTYFECGMGSGHICNSVYEPKMNWIFLLSAVPVLLIYLILMFD